MANEDTIDWPAKKDEASCLLPRPYIHTWNQLAKDLIK